jgi:hypothetical protein
MIKKETMAAANPTAMLATATLWIIDEKLPVSAVRILFDMK